MLPVIDVTFSKENALPLRPMGTHYPGLATDP